MLNWTVIFLIISLVAGVLGLSGIDVASVEIVQVLCYLFLGLCVISLLLQVARKGDQLKH